MPKVLTGKTPHEAGGVNAALAGLRQTLQWENGIGFRYPPAGKDPVDSPPNLPAKALPAGQTVVSRDLLETESGGGRGRGIRLSPDGVSELFAQLSAGMARRTRRIPLNWPRSTGCPPRCPSWRKRPGRSSTLRRKSGRARSTGSWNWTTRPLAWPSRRERDSGADSPKPLRPQITFAESSSLGLQTFRWDHVQTFRGNGCPANASHPIPHMPDPADAVSKAPDAG